MNKQTHEQQLLEAWEDIFRQGLLTFWIFVAIDQEELDVPQIKEKVTKLTNGTYSAVEQSLYRVLRKHYDVELVSMREVASPSGPNRKLYSLSKLGKRVLRDFTARNISLFNQSDITKLILEGDKS